MCRFLCWTILGLAVGLTLAETETSEELLVETTLGKIRGSQDTKSRLGEKILSFRGVRYAEPPIGVQRFQVPVPVAPWEEVFDASMEGPACPQLYSENQSEDCLRLNIYTTKLPVEDNDSAEVVKRPVIVYFHAGGFYESSAQSFILGPDYLMDHEIVLVTVNYRLGSLGFMSAGDSLLPGNLGLKDQVEALRWINKHITIFGGDPDNVTITGYSAGSWSVVLHMVSPMSKGLFHRAIASSGAPTLQEPLPKHQKFLATKQAELLQCPTDTIGNMLVCLNTKPVEDFANTTYRFYEWYNNPVLVWSPVVEPEVRGVERFLPDQPIELIRQGKFHKVPLITGITREEFGGKVVPMIEESRTGNDSKFKDLNEDWDRLAPINFIYERSTNRSKEISEKLREFYFENRTINEETASKLGELFGDALVSFPVHRLVNLIAETSDEPLYYYEFAFQGPYSHVVWNDTKKPYGVVHHDDLLYLFRVSLFPDFPTDSDALKIVERMTRIWANFAKSGQPISKEDENLFNNVTWEKFTLINPKYLEIDSNLSMKSNLNQKRMNLWDKLFVINS